MNEEIAYNEIPEGAVLVDIRDKYSYSFGAVEGSVNIPEDELDEGIAKYPEGTDFVLICRSGVISADAARSLRDKGISAASLAGGYVSWLADSLASRDELAEKALRSLRSTYSYKIMSKAKQAIKEYDMLRPGDRVGVCISGGKDSMLLALIIKELHLHGNIPFEPVYMVMDPGYSRETRAQIEENLRILDIPAVIFNTNIFTAVENEKSPCTLCAKLRRGALYDHAQQLGCNKIALGHHFDDVIETTLMGMLFGGQMQCMMPRLKAAHFENMELIRPMYLVREADVIRFKNYHKLHFIQCACHFTDTCSSCDEHSGSKRKYVKELIAQLKKENPQIEMNIYRSACKVNLATLISYKDLDGTIHSVLDN